MGARSSSNPASPSHNSNHSPEQNIDLRLDSLTLRRRPQQVRIVKCASALQKNSLVLSQAKLPDFELAFRYDSEQECTVTFYLAAKHDTGKEILLYTFYLSRRSNQKC